MQQSVVTAFITGVLGPVLVILVKYFVDKYKKKPDMITETLEISSKVTSKLEYIKDHYNCDRVWVTQFHNGGHFYPTGKSMAKFSMIYETVEIGTKSVQTNFQNIPVNLFSKSINYLLEHNTIEIPDYKDETIATHGLKYIAEDNGCKSSYLFAIKTIDNKFVGVLGLDYIKKRVRLEHEDVNSVTMHASAIGGVLSGQLKM